MKKMSLIVLFAGITCIGALKAADETAKVDETTKATEPVVHEELMGNAWDCLTSGFKEGC